MVQHHERGQSLSILNKTPTAIEGPTLLHELVPHSSDSSAIEFLEHGKRRKFSYQRLHALSDILARRIIDLTATLENASIVIPILLPQCPELYIVLLAILKAGKAFCPLNLDVPDERLRFILSDVSADLFITNTGFSDRMRSVHEVQTICVDHELLKANQNDTTALPHVASTDLAYVLYTSGSTGLPKAVSVSHRAVTQSLLAHDGHIPDFARFLQFAAPTFDVSIFEIFFPWFRGRTLVGCPRTQMLEDLPGAIKTLEADAAELTPTVVGNLLQGRTSVPGLKLLLTIGEMLTQHVVTEFGDSGTQRGILWAMYGPTEAAIHCTLQAHFCASSPTGNIGYPLETVSTFVLALSEGAVGTAGVKILPWGEEGELALGGYQIAEEYLNRPELTAVAFVDHPQYGRLYRTGDRARFCDDGTIECLGRIVAGQVKLRGQRVELGEIEQIIMKVEGCRVAVATIINDTLVAFCATGTCTVSRAEVLRVCKQWLPAFMIPSDVLLVPSMPQLPSGKIDKQSLETAYSKSLQHHGSTDLPPDDHAALTILRLTQDCLGQKLSLDSNLAAAGLDSLRAIRVASRLRAEGYGLSAVDILSLQSLYDLITTCKSTPLLNGHSHSLSWLSVQDIDATIPELASVQADIDCVSPCTPLQEAMLTETLFRSSAYCNWVELELTVTRTYDEIVTAISHLVRENGILRSGFCSSTTGTGSFVQVTWKKLHQSQVEQASNLQRSYTLDTAGALLRPFKVQIQEDLDRQRILVQIHHTLYDGWSFDLLLTDFDKLLRGLGPTARPQFQDVSHYYIERQQTTVAEDDKRYWTNLLHDYVPTTLVNYNGEIKTGTSLRSHRGRSSVSLQRLAERASDLAINPQVFFQAATGYILGLYTGSPDVVFGNVTSGRTVPVTGIEDVVGPCIASLPCRLNFGAFSRVREALEKTQSLNREGLRHCALPLRDIARAANVQPGTRLFDVLFVWQQSSSSDNSSSLAAKIVDSADDLEFKLTLEFEPCDGFISFRTTFDPCSIPEQQVTHLSRQIDEVVEKFLDDTSCTIADVGRCFTTSSLSIANSEYRHHCDSVSLSHVVETWAKSSPDKEAVIFGHVSDGVMKVKDTITYLGLNQRANQLARLLSQHGVGQDDLVCIMMEKSVDLYVAILAVLKLGSGYLPLVPDTPVERVGTILRDAQVAVCMSDSFSLQPLRKSFPGTIIDLCSTNLSIFSSHNLDIHYNGSHIAYAVFTSGSTGTPKGVLVTQQNLMSNLEFLSGIYPASSESRMLQSCSQAFDVSVFEIFYAWHIGMSLCTARKEDLFRDFEASINNLGATHLSLTPTVAALVNPDNVPKVEFLVTAGEALTEHVRRQWAGRGLYQGYGPSETTNICTVRPSVTSTDLINNIGPPFDNTSAFVLDPNSDTILPRGAVGELCFGGEQVFRGYLNRPELNATKLITIAPYGRIYRSGDMGRLLPDDCILSAGRSDDQVKIRGQRVELGEIISTILDDDAVTDCVTLLLSTENGVKTLVTFWVPKNYKYEHFTTLDAKPLRPTVLRIFISLSRQLPVYMVPSYLVPISKIPMTAQGKIDKRLLQATFNNLSDTELTQSSPTHATNGEINGKTNGTSTTLSDWEKSVAEILAHILEINVEGIRRSSSFLNLGLDSVSAIRFCHSLRRSDLGDFTVAEVLKNPTISYLDAIRVDHTASLKAHQTPLKELQNVFTEEQQSQIRSTFNKSGLQVEKINPCTPLQEAMLASSTSSETAYSNVMIFDIKGDSARLQACWKIAQSRHEILRTSFVSSDHSNFAFTQVVLKDVELQWGQLDTLHDVQSHMDTILTDLLASHRPPLHLAVHKADSSIKLIFSCHHALYDGVAIAILLEEIQQAYLDHTLPPTISYDRYLQHMISQDSAEADKFWSVRFADFEPTYFSDLTGRTHKHPGILKSIRRDLQLPLAMVRAASQRASVSVLSMVQAAWAKLLHFYTGEDDLCFGNVVSGRTLLEDGLDRLVAPCFNTLPVRTNFDFSEPNRALVQLLHNFNVDSLAHQLTALRRIQSVALQDGGRLFDTLVILQQPSRPLDDTIWTLEEDMGEMDLPVVCEVHQVDQNDVLKLTIHYNTSLLSDQDAQIVAQTFDSSLWALTQHLDAAANDSIGIPQALQATSNMSFERLPSDSDLLHKAFEQNSLSPRPDAIALDFLHADGQRTTWSYRRLNLTANHVAYRLMHQGVGIEDIVPIHIAKSPIFYASILGVLKAGAAFAPVHPDLPEARKELMFKDLNPKVILCTEPLSNPVKQGSAVVLNVADLEKGWLNACETPHVENLTGSNLAYCLYTSGSTGVPKAVSMEHRSPIQTVESSRSLVPWTPSSRLLQYAAVTFDMCYYDCFMAWTFGFTLCAAEQHIMFDDLSHVINLLDVTLLDLTPSVAASLSQAQVPSVQWLYCIGEAMSADVAKGWNGACVNSYGPTEAAFCVTMFPVSEDVKTSVIGPPYPSTSFAVFSAHGEQPLPILSVGELYIGGAQLARGYLGRPELTNERFITRCGQRFYKSGDMVRMLSDGNFEFIGRIDDQVKIRGLRVELGEINQVLQSCDACIRSVVTQIMKKNTGAKEQLVAFLAAGSGLERIEESDLRKKAMQVAKSRLPTYMVPQFYIFVDSIPKSMAGKIDRKALTRIFEAATITGRTSNDMDNDHKWTDIELHIRDVLSRLSNTPIDEVLPDTSIYQLGLDSISAVQIAATLRKQGYEASASDVMRYTSCVDLAEQLAKQSQMAGPRIEPFDFEAFDKKHRAAILEICGLDDQFIEAVRPCTPLQQGMVSQFIAKDGSVYYNYLRLQLQSSDMDIAKLKNAWAKTMMRHPILRIGFVPIRDEQYSFAMVQHTSNSVLLPWSEGYDADSQLAAERLGQLQRKALTHLHQPMWDLRVVASDKDLFLDLSIFHALFDAHSLQLVFEDVVAVYNNESLKEASPLDSVLSELLQLNQSQTEPTERFWSNLGKRTVPSRFPNMTPLKYEPASPVVLTKSSSMSAAEVEDGCRLANVTLQAAGITSWSSILSAYTGEPTVTIGVVLSGRTSETANDAALPCINTVPFPCTITDDKAETMKSVMELNADLHQHQFTPLSRIQKLMGVSNESLFDSLFAFQKITGGSQQNELWTVAEEKATTEYPISIELELRSDVLEYRLTYLPHIVPPEQAGLILQQLDHVMRSYIVPKNSPVTKALLDQSLYSITPAKESTLPSEVQLLHEFVEFTANVHPDRAAFEFASSTQADQLASKSWTYHELDVEGNRIAHLLLSRNVQQGGLVGVCFEKCPEASFAMLGILKAGCAFVAIDPSAPSARQAFIIEDSGAQVVLSMSVQSAKFKENVKLPVLDLDKIATRDFAATRPQLKRNVDPQDRSYCLYTSGTTGTPKGCELTHENAVQAMFAFQRLFAGHWDAESRWLQFASFHFDVSVLEQYWSWSVGICVVSAPRDLIFEDIANSIRTLNITHIDLTPSLAQILHPDDVPSLCKGVFITGGESLKQEILDVWGPKSVIYNGYGPTEATIGCTMYPRVPANGKPSNIGPQFDNVGSYVLKPGTDVPVLRGGVGELCVSGKLVGKGYLNRPELTKERFAHLDRFNERVYRTGDLVRVLHDGTFDFLGRADDQVKLRGQRLEIGEINSVIRQSSKNFTDVATLVLKHPKQQKEQLVAFVVVGIKSPREPKALLVEAARLGGAKEACHDKLPPYMVPTHFVPLASMPLNINNKADGKQLRHIYEALSSNDLQQLSVTSSGAESPWSEHEKRLRHVLAEALSISEEAIDKNSSFYELGMDSISVIGVSRAVKQAGFPQLTAALLLRHATIGRLSKVLSTSRTTADNRGSLIAAQQTISAIQHRYRRVVAQSLDVETRDIEALAPCTPLQQGMIVRYLNSDDGLYFSTFKFKLNRDIVVSRLRRAWNAVFEDTQVLRTAFVNTDDGYLQAVLQGATLPWSEHNVERASISDCVQDLRQSWLEVNRVELSRPFELHLVGPSGDQLLVVHIFHGLYDGNSIELLFEEVRETYDGGETEVSNVPTFHEALPHGPLRIAEGAKQFWEGHLIDRTPRSLPSLTQELTQGTIVVTRDFDSIPAYDTTRRKLKVTAQAIAQACWMHVLQEYVQVPINTGMVVSGRSLDLERADHVIGPMFNTIPYQHHTQVGDTWASIIARVHNFNTAAVPYQHTPLRDIIKWCKRCPNQPLFDTLFVYQVAQTDKDWWRSNPIWTLLDGDAVADYPLAIEIEQKSHDRFSLTLVTQGHISSATTSNKLLDRFEEALTSALADPSTVLETSVKPSGSNPNGVAAGHYITNGVNGTTEFDWTENAITIREEIANLTGAEVVRVSESTSIFELGLDSIDAIKLSSRLRKRGINLPVSGIMRGLTIQSMVNNIQINQTNGTLSQDKGGLAHRKSELRHYLESHAVDMGKVDDVLPLTPLQEAMVAEMIASDYARYYNFDVAELAADTDVDRLHDAWHMVIKSTPMLRTAFIEVDDPKIDEAYAQVVVKQKSLEHCVKRQKCDTVEKPNVSAIFEDLRRAAAQSNALDPPFKINFVETSELTYQVLSIAHALYDGWSLGLLHDAVSAAYRGQYTPPPSYEATLAEILAGSGPDAASFWRDYLNGLKPSLFPRRNLGATEIGTVFRKERASDIGLSYITVFAKNSKVSLQTLGQTTFALTLASYVGSLDVTFGCVLSGRDDDEKSQLLFPTMNTAPIRTVLHGSRQELLQYVQENFINIKQWQHYPLRKASALAGAQGRLFNSLFIYQKSAEQDSSTERKLYQSIEAQSDVEYPVCVEMEVVNDTLIWRCAVKDEVMDFEGSRALLNKLDQVLCNIIQSPEEPTINSTPQGTSVCGLPAFKEESSHMLEVENTNEQSSPSIDAPLSETATKIREVLASVAQVNEQDIEPGMSIFHIGLDSISAIKVSSILRKQGIALSVGEMLKAGTVEMMAETAGKRTTFLSNGHTDSSALIKHALRGLDQDKALSWASIEASQVDRILPLTAGQLYMLSMWLNTKGANFYAEFTYHLEGAVSSEALHKLWQDLITANPVLRTHIVTTGQSDLPYVQVVLKEANPSLTDITVQDKESATQTMNKTATQQPWVHLFVSRTASGWMLKFKIHHALYDGVSLPLLMQQLLSLCNGATPSTPGHTFDEYVAVSHTASAPSQRKAFWTQYLEGIEPHYNAKAEVFSSSKTEIFKPGLLQASSLESIARQHGISTHALFLAAYAKLYAAKVSRAKGEDVVIGIYLANRSLPIDNLSTAAIPTVNLLPLRVRLPLNTSIIDAATEIQRDLQAIGEPVNATTSLFEISEWTDVKIDTFVNFLSLPDADDEDIVKRDDGVKITQEASWQEAVSRVTELDHGDWEAIKEMVDERVNAAYLHAIDVEATVRNGKLDVGVFALTGMLSLEDGENLIENLKSELNDLDRA
ncbi:nonribosomal peptide synthetase-like protein 2 [Macroventuria anomochaeta]|uniref:Nonribosomal peptide synthetase-like protein 2 n=1 Tax=Macroventuria anomochaeta TaxID=301207 RepID=A0ACB6SEK9_9PLEO|nr:nonribosomal peptide synthetase-like protein 2 [Macroventuria anomochaeta]KAF2632433.1 nonribosomal peptide synthetase-like protein 2 [Macroventuria anomochaeta]